MLTNDTDIDGGGKFIASNDPPLNGSVTVLRDESFRPVRFLYQPGFDFCGEDTFTYTLNGGSTATVSVTVTCVDDPPVAVNDSATLTEDDPATSIDVFANDADFDGGPMLVQSKTDGVHGSVAVADDGATLTYQPNADYCGPDSFTYTLNGGSTATVSVTVTCVDDPPVAVDDKKTIDEDAAATVIQVRSNDIDDGGTKAIESATDPANGTVVLQRPTRAASGSWRTRRTRTTATPRRARGPTPLPTP